MNLIVRVAGRLLAVFVLMQYASIISANENWELKKQASGISVYTRDVPGSDIREFRGDIEIAAGLNSLMAVLDDTEGFCKWMHNCSVAKLIYKPSLLERYQYLVNDFPWPASDRDMLLRNDISQDPVTGVVTVALTAVPLSELPDAQQVAVPNNDDLRRVERLQGFFELTPISNAKSKVRFQLHMDPAGRLPASLVNSLIVDNPFETLQGLQKQVLRPEYHHFDPF